MNNSIKLGFVVAAAVAGITACTSTPTAQHNVVPQTSSTPTSETSSAPTVVTEVVTQTVTNPPKPEAIVKVDNRIGYGLIKLGMTLEEVRAAGLTDLTWDSSSCVADDKLAISKTHGVERITVPADAETSKGIGVGSTFADVKRAYPNATEFRAGWGAPVDVNARYSFEGRIGSDANKVVTIKLTATGGGCANAQL